MTDVSIIVPIYKVEAYIRPALDSILMQTHKNIEVILVDDGSPDNCGAICDEYAAKDGRVRVIHKKNEGTGMARNTGMDAATGEYLYFCDPDDLIDPLLVEDNLAIARRHNADVVVFGFNRVSGDRTEEFLPKLSGVYNYQEFWDNFPQANDLMSSLWLRLFKKSYIDKHGLRACTLSTAQDAYFLFDTYSAPFDVMVFNQKSYYTYLIHGNSAVTAYKPERFENQYKVCAHFEEIVHNTPQAKGRYQDIIDHKYIVSFIVAFKNLVHAREIPFDKKVELAKGYRARPAILAALRRAKFSQADSFSAGIRTLMLRFGMLGLLMKLDSRRSMIG